VNTRHLKTKQRCVVFFMIAWAGQVFPCGVVPASASPAIATGAIFGGFFTDAPPLPEIALPGRLQAVTGVGPGLCETAIANASAGHQLPPGLLGAIAVVESGRLDPRTGETKPWPWTIDANGTGYAYDSEGSAIQAAAAFEAAGITSLDIGCLQVNLAQHPEAFQTLAEAFDPVANADYAAGFLTSLNQKFGNWPQAVAAYHSQTPALGAPYATKVYAAWQGPGAAPPLAMAAVANSGPALPTPVQPAFAMSTMAPPMPQMRLGRTTRGMTSRDLASYRASPVMIATRLGARTASGLYAGVPAP
jgi:hypothetical protein